MRKGNNLKLLLFLIMFTINITFCYAENYIGTVTGTGVNLRKGPGTNYSVIKSVAQSARYKLVSNDIIPSEVECSEGWYKLYYEGSNKGNNLPEGFLVRDFSNMVRALRQMYNHRDPRLHRQLRPMGLHDSCSSMTLNADQRGHQHTNCHRAQDAVYLV